MDGPAATCPHCGQDSGQDSDQAPKSEVSSTSPTASHKLPPQGGMALLQAQKLRIQKLWQAVQQKLAPSDPAQAPSPSQNSNKNPTHASHTPIEPPDWGSWWLWSGAAPVGLWALQLWQRLARIPSRKELVAGIRRHGMGAVAVGVLAVGVQAATTDSTPGHAPILELLPGIKLQGIRSSIYPNSQGQPIWMIRATLHNTRKTAMPAAHWVAELRDPQNRIVARTEAPAGLSLDPLTVQKIDSAKSLTQAWHDAWAQGGQISLQAGEKATTAVFMLSPPGQIASLVHHLRMVPGKSPLYAPSQKPPEAAELKFESDLALELEVNEPAPKAPPPAQVPVLKAPSKKPKRAFKTGNKKPKSRKRRKSRKGSRKRSRKKSQN